MEIALARPALKTLWAERPEGVRSLENWLLCWVLLPNIGFWLLWIVGGPPRAVPILVTGLIGIVLHRAPFPLKFAGFATAMILSALYFVAALFNLSVVSVVDSLRFAAELSPSASLEYIISGAAVVATLAGAWWSLRRSTSLVAPTRIIIAAAITVIVASVDTAMAEANRGSYSRTPEAGAPFTSAVAGSGLMNVATGERHVVMIMVEAMGQPSDPAVRRRLLDLWASPAVRARYDVTSGDTLFYGSTTSGEMRELCGRWGDYAEVMQARDPSCLPARLAARGYRSQAWHSFNGTFFDRTAWYPNIGFDRMRFADDLIASGAERCPGVFVGACDRDIPRQIGGELKQARGPQFLYWLTVNSHLPILRNRRLRTEECRRFDARLDEESPMTCRLMQLFGDTAQALSREITATDFPEADILIVGDHIPPFFDRHHRNQFEPDRVPWILLRARGPTAPQRVATAA